MYRETIIEFEDGLVVGNNGSVRPPSTYQVSTGDIDVDDQRSMSGYLNRNRVRGGSNTVYTLTVTWDRLTWEELVALIASGEAAKFDVTFLDPKSNNGYTTRTMYRDANMTYELIKIFSDEEAYWKTSMSFVEY